MPIFSTNVVSFLSTEIVSNMRPFIIIVVILFSYKDGDVRYLCKVEYLLRIFRHLLTQGNMIELEVFDYLDQLWKENIITTVILFSIFNIGCCFWYVKDYVAWGFVQFDSLREELYILNAWESFVGLYFLLELIFTQKKSTTNLIFATAITNHPPPHLPT